MNQDDFARFRTLALEQEASRVEHDHIEENLRKAGAPDELIRVIIGEIKEVNRIRRKKRGFKLVFAGCFLLVFGFLITLALFHSNTGMQYAMYGLTTLGIVLLLWGMIDLMGW